MSTAIAVARSIPPSCCERLLRPRDDHLLGVREARRLREARPRVDHERPPAGGAREPAQRGREVDRAEDDQPRRRERDVDEQHRVVLDDALGALGPHQLVGVRGGRASSSAASPSVPRARPVGEHEQLGARLGALEHGDQRAAAAGAGQLGEGGLLAHGS